MSGVNCPQADIALVQKVMEYSLVVIGACICVAAAQMEVEVFCYGNLPSVFP